jgi:hypothetical protein
MAPYAKLSLCSLSKELNEGQASTGYEKFMFCVRHDFSRAVSARLMTALAAEVRLFNKVSAAKDRVILRAEKQSSGAKPQFPARGCWIDPRVRFSPGTKNGDMTHIHEDGHHFLIVQ